MAREKTKQQAMTKGACARRAAWAAVALACACGICALPRASAEEIMWYQSMTLAQEAAAKSGKPVYVYIYAVVQDPNTRLVQLLPTCRRMVDDTFGDPKIIELLSKFECCALDAGDPDNKELVDKYARAVARDPDAVTVGGGRLPAHAFLGADGQEHYVCWGYAPPAGFAIILTSVLRIIDLKAAIAQNPQDARAHADIGHLLMELGQAAQGASYAEARRYLRTAVEQDPQNKVGALEDATLDLHILSLADDPAKGYAALADFLKQFPESKRVVEAHYWQAVALYAQGTPEKYKQALKLLEPFRTTDQTAPEYHSRWCKPALELEKTILMQLGLSKPPDRQRRVRTPSQ